LIFRAAVSTIVNASAVVVAVAFLLSIRLLPLTASIVVPAGIPVPDIPMPSIMPVIPLTLVTLLLVFVMFPVTAVFETIGLFNAKVPVPIVAIAEPSWIPSPSTS